ncbi:MAG: phosphate acetyltransferase [Candidatus Omnitrophica bacterium]|nr:phosphate acetyltransferase [Candidatus Omnitrophota bacterium]
MDEIIKKLWGRAKSDPKVIVFPESQDERVIEAVKRIEQEKIAKPLLLTPDNLKPEHQEEFASIFFERKKAKGVTFEEARELMNNPLYYGAMMTRYGSADGLVAGAAYTTSSVLRAVLGCLEIDKSAGVLSSAFIMIVPNCSYGENGVFVFADCSVIPQPSSGQLANIAISSARFTSKVLGVTPRVAFLSFSTKGSAKNKSIQKVKEAVEIAKSKNSGFSIDGELQADSALVPEIAARKLSESEVAGRANVLIFPDLDSGNICYKLTQRLANARAIGPIILGTVQPCSDLSRGCDVNDIVDCAAVTVIRAQEKSKTAKR